MPHIVHNRNSQVVTDPRQQLFLRLLSASYLPLFSYIRSLVPADSDAEDVMQEVCVVLWEKFDDFDPQTSFIRWSCVIAFNIANAFCRDQRRQKKIAFSGGILKELWRTRTGVSELFELRRELLEGCFSKLPTADQEFLRQFYSGTTAQEISESSGQTVHAVYERLRKLRRKLFDCINGRLGGQHADS